MTAVSTGNIEALVDLVAEYAPGAERERGLPAPVFQAFNNAGIFRLAAPAMAGGLEADPARVMRVVEALARADGGIAWCAMIAATSSVVAGHLHPDLARRIFADERGVLVGPLAPSGRATITERGLELTGRWPFVSMCESSTWIMAGCTADDGARRLALFPTQAATVHDTWDVLGLRATGSHDIEVEHLMVPDEHTVDLLLQSPVDPGPLYRFPVRGLLAAGIASVGLGVARGAVDDLVELARAKTPAYSIRRLADRPSVQAGVATADVRVRAARGLLHEAVDEAWEAAKAEAEVPLELRLRLRQAAAHAMTTARDAVDRMYEAGGGSSIYLRNEAQKRLRDVHTATQHVMMSPAVLEVAGRGLLGLQVEQGQV